VADLTTKGEMDTLCQGKCITSDISIDESHFSRVVEVAEVEESIGGGIDLGREEGVAVE